MTPPDIKAHDKLLAYMLGWSKGAGGGCFTDAQMNNDWFKAGWEDGRNAKQKVYADASARLGAELSIIRDGECK